MKEFVGRAFDIATVALVLGLLLLHWEGATALVAQGGATTSDVFRAFSFQKSA